MSNRKWTHCGSCGHPDDDHMNENNACYQEQCVCPAFQRVITIPLAIKDGVWYIPTRLWDERETWTIPMNYHPN